MINKFISDNKGQSEWNALYTILIVAIVAVVLIAVVKPLFKDYLKTGLKQEGVNPASGN